MFPEVASHGGSGISSGEGYSKNNNDGGMIQWARETNHPFERVGEWGVRQEHVSKWFTADMSLVFLGVYPKEK